MPQSLRTEKLIKSYSGRTVVDQVSLRLEKGEIVGLLGPNGAGKSTTFNMVVGLVRPDSGAIFLDDKSIHSYPVHKRAQHGIGYLAQDKSIFRKLSVEDNIKAILQTTKLDRNQQKEKLEQLMEELGVTKLRKQQADKCSGGERRRVEIARALVCDPDFMLLDEPFSGVDPKAVEEIQEIIYHLAKRGLGVLITDHSVRETLTVTDRAYLISEGKVMVEGNAEQIVNDPEARRLYLGERFYMDTRPDERRSQIQQP
jgi:lipopolysaccharide export system ATP-binding protein